MNNVMRVWVRIDLPGRQSVKRALDFDLSTHLDAMEKLDYPDKESLDPLAFRLLCSTNYKIADTEEKRLRLANAIRKPLVDSIMECLAEHDTVMGYSNAEHAEFRINKAMP